MPRTEEPITELSAEECWEYLQSNTVARLAVSVNNEVDIFPLNYYADGTTILFRTAPGTKLLELSVNNRVALEIDGHTETDAWSVVVKGTARPIELQSEINEADETPLTPWVPTLKYRYVRIEPTQLTGRYFERSGEPERY